MSPETQCNGGIDASLVLDGHKGIALRVAADLTVAEVLGQAIAVPVGCDVREAIPALYGIEDDLLSERPDIDLPYMQLDGGESSPVSVVALRDPETGFVWLLLRDVSKEAALRRELMQQRNSLALAHAELTRARDAALAADRTKTSFLANVSHELRTPLHVVIGGAAIIEKSQEKALPPGDVVAFARDIHESGTLLLQLVDDLIDLSRSETGNLTLYEEWCDLDRIVATVASLARDLPDIGATEIAYAPSEGLPEFYGDSRRIKQILLNLLSNAVKAVAPAGRIVVGVAQGPDGQRYLEVSDDGPGMTVEALSIALEPFGQPAAAVRARGAGLGLAIVDRLARLHDGRLEIETAPDRGLRARVTLSPERFSDTGKIDSHFRT